MNTIIAVAPTGFTPVPFSGRAAFPLTLSISWNVPAPPAESYWGMGMHTVFDGFGFVPLHEGFEVGAGNLTYTGPTDDGFYYHGYADYSLNGGPVSSCAVNFASSPVGLSRLTLRFIALNAAANAVLVHGGTLTATVTFRDMHVFCRSGPSSTYYYALDDKYDASGVLAAGALQLIATSHNFDFLPDPGFLLPGQPGQLSVFYSDVATVTGTYGAAYLINPAGSAFTYSIDHGATFAFARDGGTGPDWVWNASPLVTTLYTLIITYANGLVVIRTGTLKVSAPRKGDHVDMAQDHASGLITIIRSVTA